MQARFARNNKAISPALQPIYCWLQFTFLDKIFLSAWFSINQGLSRIKCSCLPIASNKNAVYTTFSLHETNKNKVLSSRFFTNLFRNTNYIICESQIDVCVHPILFCGQSAPTHPTNLYFNNNNLWSNYHINMKYSSFYRCFPPLSKEHNLKSLEKLYSYLWMFF